MARDPFASAPAMGGGAPAPSDDLFARYGIAPALTPPVSSPAYRPAMSPAPQPSTLSPAYPIPEGYRAASAGIKNEPGDLFTRYGIEPPEEPGIVEKTMGALYGLGKGVAMGVKGLPAHAEAVWQGPEVYTSPTSEEQQQAAQQRMAEFRESPEGQMPAWGGTTGEWAEAVAPNIPQGLENIVGAGAGAVAGTAMGGPIIGLLGGIAGGMGASLYPAYRETQARQAQAIIEKEDQDRLQKGLAPRTLEEKQARAAEIAPDMPAYGLWEAGTELPGTAIETAMALNPWTRAAAPIAKPIMKLLSGKALKTGAKTAAKMIGVGIPTEIAEEAAAQMGEHPLDIKYGLAMGPQRKWTSPEDWWQSVEEVAKPTAMGLAPQLLTGGLIGGMGAVRAGVQSGRMRMAVLEAAADPQTSEETRQAALSIGGQLAGSDWGRDDAELGQALEVLRKRPGFVAPEAFRAPEETMPEEVSYGIHARAERTGGGGEAGGAEISARAEPFGELEKPVRSVAGAGAGGTEITEVPEPHRRVAEPVAGAELGEAGLGVPGAGRGLPGATRAGIEPPTAAEPTEEEWRRAANTAGSWWDSADEGKRDRALGKLGGVDEERRSALKSQSFAELPLSVQADMANAVWQKTRAKGQAGPTVQKPKPAKAVPDFRALHGLFTGEPSIEGAQADWTAKTPEQRQAWVQARGGGMQIAKRISGKVWSHLKPNQREYLAEYRQEELQREPAEKPVPSAVEGPAVAELPAVPVQPPAPPVPAHPAGPPQAPAGTAEAAEAEGVAGIKPAVGVKETIERAAGVTRGPGISEKELRQVGAWERPAAETKPVKVETKVEARAGVTALSPLAPDANGIIWQKPIEPEQPTSGTKGNRHAKIIKEGKGWNVFTGEREGNSYVGEPQSTFFAGKKAARAAAESYLKNGTTTPESAKLEKQRQAEGEKSAALEKEEKGDFGPIFRQFRHDAKGAIEHLTKLKDGEAVAALHHPEVGDIDLVWGKAPNEKTEGYGLAKIIAKHPEVLTDLQGFLTRLKKNPEISGPNRIRLQDKNGHAIVSLNWFGKRKTWLLTAYEERGGAAARMDTGGLAAEVTQLALPPPLRESLTQTRRAETPAWEKPKAAAKPSALKIVAGRLVRPREGVKETIERAAGVTRGAGISEKELRQVGAWERPAAETKPAKVETKAKQPETEPAKRKTKPVKPEKETARPTPSEWKKIGVNSRGNAVYQDDRGVRSYVEDGIRVSETVGIIPGGGIEIDEEARKPSDFLTTEEPKKPPKEAKAAETQPIPAKPTAETAPGVEESAQTTKARADLKDALADLGKVFLDAGLFSKAAVPAELDEARLVPALTRVLDAAFRLGYHKFKDAARFALDTIREHFGDKAADAITLDHLQGSYIAMAGKYQGKGADTKKSVIGFETLEEVLEPEVARAEVGAAERIEGENRLHARLENNRTLINAALNADEQNYLIEWDKQRRKELNDMLAEKAISGALYDEMMGHKPEYARTDALPIRETIRAKGEAATEAVGPEAEKLAGVKEEPAVETKPKELEEGDRVVVVSHHRDDLSGRHGVVEKKSVLQTRMVTLFGGGPERTERYVTYTVKTDAGAVLSARPEEIQAEEGPAPAVEVPDIEIEGKHELPDLVWASYRYEIQQELNYRAKGMRAKKADMKAQWAKEADNQKEKAAKNKAAFDAWAQKYPDAAIAASDGQWQPKTTAEEKAAVTEKPDTTIDARLTGPLNGVTNKGNPVFVVGISERVDPDTFAKWRALAGKAGGLWWGKGRTPGFSFKTREQALAFLRGEKTAEKPESLADNEVRPTASPYVYRLNADGSWSWQARSPGQEDNGQWTRANPTNDWLATLEAGLKAKSQPAAVPEEPITPPALQPGEGGIKAEKEHAHPVAETVGKASAAGAAGEGAALLPGTRTRRPVAGVRGAAGGRYAGGIRPGIVGADIQAGARGGGREAGTPGEATGDNLGTKPDLEPNPANVARIPAAGDYRIGAGELKREGSWLDTARRNVDIIELVHKIEQEDRQATPEEQALLVKFTGWGAGDIRNNLFPTHAGVGRDYKTWYLRGEWKDLGERIKEVFTADDWRTVLKSTQYAHYTSEPVVRSIWRAMERMGFSGGSVLEPGAGIGLFAGLMPDSIARNSQYVGVEMDGFSAKIAQLLLPGQTINPNGQGDYVASKLPKSFFDAAIGNPPFSRTKIPYNGKKLSLHDFFFAKTLDQVRPGGLMAFVTSRYTMDKKDDAARKYLMERADLLGAVRLPQTAFKANAGTEVTTDVLWFRKREPGQLPGGAKWEGLAEVESMEGDKIQVNEYFAVHPEMVLGRHSTTAKSLHAGENYGLVPMEGVDIEDLFAAAIEQLPANVYSVAGPSASVRTVRAAAVEKDFNPKHRKEGGIYLSDDGRLMRVEEGAGTPLESIVKLSAKEKQWITDYLPLRDALKQAHYDQLTDGEWKISLKNLQTAYDRFVKKHGPVLDYTLIEKKDTDEDGNEIVRTYQRYKNERPLRMDVEGALLSSLETIKEDGSIVKAPVLLDRVLKKPVTPKIESVHDALAVSLAQTGRFDIDDVAALAGVGREAAIGGLGDLVYELPDGGWQLADEYLSGDVKSKLEEAITAARLKPQYARNVEALNKVQPEPLGADQVTVGLGASWVPLPYVRQFAQEILEIPGADITFNPVNAEWGVVANVGPQVSRKASAAWGTAARSPSEVLDAALNHRTFRIYSGSGTKDDPRVFDEEATNQANEMVSRVQAEFSSWVWTDSQRTENLLELYNDKFNRLAPRYFNADWLDPPGLSLKFKLHAHQKRAIWRAIQTGNTYFAHSVGAGKTLEMIISGMEQKRLGLISKPMYAVPNHMLAQFAREFLEAYPSANIMVADEFNFHTDNRRRFVAQAALNNPDAIIITHSAFNLLEMKEENIREAFDDVLNDLRETLEDIPDDWENRKTRTQIEAQMERIERSMMSKEAKAREKAKGTKGEKAEKAAQAAIEAAKNAAVNFEDLGVDFLFVDEAHTYRKLDYSSKMKVKGLSPDGSAGALRLFVKTRWLEKQRPGRSFIFASGTPVTNTMAELFTIQRFFQEAQLRAMGMIHFDSWAAQFGRVKAEYERNATGAWESVNRFSKFVNVADMMAMVRQFMDVLTMNELGGIVKLPEAIPGNAGRRDIVTTPQPEALSDYMMGELSRRLEASRAWKPSREEPNNPDPVTNIITDGRLAAIDMRFIDNSLPSDPDSKLNKLIDRIAEDYQLLKDNEYIDPETGKVEKEKGGTQIVFASVGLGEGVAASRGFDAKAWMKKRLKEAGIPADQIAFMEEQKKAADKEKLFKEMRQGKVRILIGTPKNMGTGVNVQKRLARLYHLDAPWYPADVEQPEGRILRQGNQNEQVGITGFATDGTYDSTMWGMVARKAGFIEQAFAGDRSLRVMDDTSEASAYSMAAAIASGDQRYIQLAQLEAELARLETQRATWERQQRSLRLDIEQGERNLTEYRKRLAVAKAIAKDLEGRTFYSGSYDATVAGIALKSPKSTELGEALLREYKQIYGTADTEARAKAAASDKQEKGGARDGVTQTVETEKEIADLGGGIKVHVNVWAKAWRKANKDGKLTNDVSAYPPRGEVSIEVNGREAWSPVNTAAPEATTPELLGRQVNSVLNEAVNMPGRIQGRIDETEAELERLRKRFGAPFANAQAQYEMTVELENLRRDLVGEGKAVPEKAVPQIAFDLPETWTFRLAEAGGRPRGTVHYLDALGGMRPAEREPDIQFSKASELKPGEKPNGISREQAQRAIDEFKAGFPGAARLDFVVRDNAGQAFGPEHAEKNIKGGYLPKDNRIVILREALDSVSDATATLRHETLAHYGLNLFTPEVKRQILQAIVNSRKARFIAKEFRLIEERYPELADDPLVQAEEVLARIAENPASVPQQWLDRFIAFLARALRKIGFLRGKITKAEMRQLIESIGEGIRRGAPQRTFPASNQAQFAREARAFGVSPEQLRREFDAVRNRYFGTKDWMKAPNGKPTQLNERQWLMVRTPRFKAWFGNWMFDSRQTMQAVAVPPAIVDDLRNVGDLRRWLKKTYQGDSIVNLDTNQDITIYGDGIDASLKNRNPLARRAYSALPALIREAVYFDYEENTKRDKKPDVLGYEIYKAVANIDGKFYPVTIKVDLMHPEKRGSGYYYHQVERIELGDPVDMPGGHAKSLVPPGASSPGFTLAQLMGDNKPEFSQVVDENGEPRVVFHGSNAAITAFVTEKLGAHTGARSAQKGFFFAGDPHTSARYIFGDANEWHRSLAMERDRIAEERGIKPSQVDIKEMRIFKLFNELEALEREYGLVNKQRYPGIFSRSNLTAEASSALDRKLADLMEKRRTLKSALDFFQRTTGQIEANDSDIETMGGWIPYDPARGAEPNVMSIFLNLRNPLIHDYDGELYRDVSYAELLQEAAAENHDGAIFRNTYDGAELTDIFVAFEPEQIKSATGNTGEFSRLNPDIRFSKGAIPPVQKEDRLSRERMDRFGDSIRGAREWSGKVAQDLGDQLARASGPVKRHSLGLLSQRQLAQVAEKWLPVIKRDYIPAWNAMRTEANRIHQEADRIGKEEMAYYRAKRTASEALSALKHDSTLAGVDPSASEYRPLIEHEQAMNRVKVLMGQIRGRSGENPAKKMEEIQAIRAKLAFERKRKARFQALRDRFLALDKEGQRLFVQARDFYKERGDARLAELKAAIEREETFGHEKKRRLRELQEAFEANRVTEPYFPLFRKGDYWVYTEDPSIAGDDRFAFDTFETEREAKRFADDLRKQGVKVLGRGKRLENITQLSHVDPGFVAKIDQLMAELGDDPKVTALRDAVYQTFLRTLPDVSMRKHQIHRKKRRGWSEDALQALADYAFHEGKQFARLKHGWKLENTLRQVRETIERSGTEGRMEKARDELEWLGDFQRDYFPTGKAAKLVEEDLVAARARLREYPDDPEIKRDYARLKFIRRWADIFTDPSRDAPHLKAKIEALRESIAMAEKLAADEAGAKTFATDVYSELQQFHDFMMNPNTHPLAIMINSFNFAVQLGAMPVSALANMLQTPIVALPSVAANPKIGWTAALAAFGQAARQFMSRSREKGQLVSLRWNLKGDEARAFREFLELGLIEDTQAHDLAGLAREGVHRGERSRKFMEAVSFFFHHAERFNREVTAMAAYRLARSRLGMSHEQATRYAEDQVWGTHFDYDSENRARVMRGNVARVALQFKNYSQHMTYLLSRSVWEAFRGESPEVKREAVRRLGGILGMQFLFAGAAGLPVGLLSMAMPMLEGLFGDPDEPWPDWKIALRQGIADVAGPTVAEAATRGLVDALTPISLHDRLSMEDMWFREPEKELGPESGKAWTDYLMRLLLGPTAGYADNIARGVQRMSRGEMYRGMELLMPNAIKAGMRDMRYAFEGEKTGKGLVTAEPLSPGEDLASMLVYGARPSRIVARQEETGARKEMELALTARRSDLIEQMTAALQSRDPDELHEARAAVAAWNRKHPSYPITSQSIMQSRRATLRNVARSVQGAAINPRLRREVVGAVEFAE